MDDNRIAADHLTVAAAAGLSLAIAALAARDLLWKPDTHV